MSEPDWSEAYQVVLRSCAMGAAAGSVVGALVGSLLAPVVGSVLGALAGGLVGAVTGLINAPCVAVLRLRHASVGTIRISSATFSGLLGFLVTPGFGTLRVISIGLFALCGALAAKQAAYGLRPCCLRHCCT